MTTLTVVNIKCGGCEKSIISALQKLGCTNVTVDVTNQKISFEGGDIEKVKKELSKMGYPEANSPQAKSLLKKATSYASCMVGRLKK
jgi:copper chaperone CopZ